MQLIVDSKLLKLVVNQLNDFKECLKVGNTLCIKSILKAHFSYVLFFLCFFSKTILCSANQKTLKCFLTFILCSGWKQETESVDHSRLTPYAISLAVLSLFSLFCDYFASQHWLHGWHSPTLMLIQLDSLKAIKAWKIQAALTTNRINTF